MNIKEFSHNLLKLYQEMSESFSAYQNSTGWSCPPGCGQCCINPDVEASIFEMLPMAFKIYEEGKLEEWITKLENSEWSHCPVFEPGKSSGQGRCGKYEERPSVCRMFGVAGYKNKQNEITLSICKKLRADYHIEKIPTDLDVNETPIIAQWTYRLSGLAPELTQNRLPIREALLQALNKIFIYAYYQELSSEEKSRTN